MHPAGMQRQRPHSGVYPGVTEQAGFGSDTPIHYGEAARAFNIAHPKGREADPLRRPVDETWMVAQLPEDASRWWAENARSRQIYRRFR